MILHVLISTDQSKKTLKDRREVKRPGGQGWDTVGEAIPPNICALTKRASRWEFKEFRQDTRKFVA